MVPPVMDGEEFRDLGYLQEVNRRVLHPLGLALYNDQGWTRERVETFLAEQGVQFGRDAIDNVMTFLSRSGLTREHIGGCLDDRGDPEGWRFAVREDHLDEDIAEFERKRINVESEWFKRSLMRQNALGYIVQEAIHVPGVTNTPLTDEEAEALAQAEDEDEPEEFGDVEGYT